MKKAFYAITAALLLLGLGSCGEQNPPTPADSFSVALKGTTDVMSSSATVNLLATIRMQAFDPSKVKIGVLYSTSESMSGALKAWSAEAAKNNTTQSVSVELNGLAASTKYWVQGVIMVEGKEYKSSVSSFETAAEGADEFKISISGTENLVWNGTDVKMNSYIKMADFDPEKVKRGVVYSKKEDMSDSQRTYSDVAPKNMVEQEFSVSITGLSPLTAYWIQGVINDGTKDYLSEKKSFETPAGMNAVDLGLAIDWGEMNLGASSPAGFGDYYAWAAVEPFYAKGHAYDLVCNDWRHGYGPYDGNTWKVKPADFKTSIVDFYPSFGDANDAVKALLGDKWRMPTREDFTELLGTKEKGGYQWTEVTLSELDPFGEPVKAMKLSYSDGKKVVEIVFPYCGYRDGSNFVKGGGLYWSRSGELLSGKGIGFSSNPDSMTAVPYIGAAIRPVRVKN